jgi:hypothetical protein
MATGGTDEFQITEGFVPQPARGQVRSSFLIESPK